MVIHAMSHPHPLIITIRAKTQFLKDVIVQILNQNALDKFIKMWADKIMGNRVKKEQKIQPAGKCGSSQIDRATLIGNII